GGWRAGRPSEGGTPGGGYGLIGMRERVEAASGRLDVTEVGLPTGICVSGEVPRHGANEAGGGRAGPLSLPFRDPEDGSAARAERTAAVPQEGRASVEAA
ncbi:MAG: hypothetical protein H7Y08_11615, partial [Rhizobiaceae bacterium]|nr:hypothetical protein [Rhizobiaceae bacterium]